MLESITQFKKSEFNIKDMPINLKNISSNNHHNLPELINKVTFGLRVNPDILLEYINENEAFIGNKHELIKLMINQALKLTNINHFENLDWRFVAARLLLTGIINEASITRKIDIQEYKQSYYDFLLIAIENNLYDKKIIENYTKEEIDEISKTINFEYDFGFDYAGMNLLSSRYLVKLKGKAFELPQEMFLSIALLLALPEKKADRLKIATEFYHAIASRKISLATPIVLNLRKPSGNLSSCFIGAMDDSLDSIYYTLDQLAQISKNAGGCGVNISRVRASGSYIRGVKGASSGIMPWIKLINDTGIAVNQQGARAGAITVALDIWHLDIEDFLHSQTENGDLRKKAFDIFPQIVIPDLYMERVEANQSWHLFDPNEVKSKFDINLAELYGPEFREKYLFLEEQNLDFKKKIDAKEFFKTFLKTVVETGMPYVTFKDTINATNPNKHAGMIGNANLCTESFSNFKPSTIISKELQEDQNTIIKHIRAGELHTCNLVSLNLSIIDDKELDNLTALSVRILDNTIEISTTPVQEANKHNKEYRILGVGSMGLADWLVKKKLTYSNSTKQVSDLYEKIAYAGINASIELAEERGTYQKYQGSEWSKGIVFGKDKEWFKQNETALGEKWVSLIDKLKTNGIRNGGLFAIAPNTSTSLLMGSTASILPVFSKFFIDKASNGSVPICPPLLNEDTFWYYQENKNIDQQKIVNIVSEIQKWTDQGISMELYLNLNSGIRAKDIYNLYINAWKKKCKTVYYVRSIALKNEKEDCISCAN